MNPMHTVSVIYRHRFIIVQEFALIWGTGIESRRIFSPGWGRIAAVFASTFNVITNPEWIITLAH
jgi:hypothetical protein